MNLCNIVPGGMVCFFPSYDYENKVVSIWKACNILEKMNAKKKVKLEIIIGY